MNPKAADAPSRELTEILCAIREVEASLDRREIRAAGAIAVVWGVVAGSIFAFYHLALGNLAAFTGVFGAALSWLWLLPCAFGYAATAVVGARVGRAASKGEESEETRFLLRALVLPTALTAILTTEILPLTLHLIPGIWVAFLGILMVRFNLRHASRYRGPALALGALALAGGTAMLALTPAWGFLAAALVYGVGLVGYGTLKYREGA